MIEITGLRKRFGAQVILDGVDLTVHEGETLALLGPSGTGKSVLLKHIIGLIRPDAGQVVVVGRHVEGLGRKELSALRAWLIRGEVSVDAAEVPLAEPVAGGAELHRLLTLLRQRDRREGRSGDGVRSDRR